MWTFFYKAFKSFMLKCLLEKGIFSMNKFFAQNSVTRRESMINSQRKTYMHAFKYFLQKRNKSSVEHDKIFFLTKKVLLLDTILLLSPKNLQKILC